ncbi:MAG: ankyrin repeat domain-containing protein, partial [Elusimicrobiaceae bacterium]|nr:ankyrin repeat domain-containing protein [Elusimicrobiaceae bacterium]
MKKLLLAVLVSLVASVGFAQTDEPTEAEIAEMMKVYKAYKAKQNATAQAQAQANPQARYEKALIEAAKEGNASQVRGLLEAGTNPNVTDDKGNTPLIYAAKENLACV